MYLVNFIRKDGGPNEEYYYHAEKEAVSHMALFAEDNSNLYKCIVVSDESKNKVLQILCFDDEGKATSFKDGDIVRLHPDYCEMEERQFLYMITNINDRTMRAQIGCLNSGLRIPGTETVGLEMITPIDTAINSILHTNNILVDKI